MAKAVAPVPAQEIAPSYSRNLAEVGEEFDGLDSGLENVTAADLLIPRLTILQALSPQLQRSKPEYIPDAKAGQFCDTATGEVFDELLLVPTFYARVFLEWAPRNTGRGLVANYGTDASILDKCKNETDAQGVTRTVTPNGNYIAETATFFVLNLTTGRRSFIPMASTQLRNARRWLTLITSERLRRSNPKPGQSAEFQPPIFYRSWLATSATQSNAKGEWWGWHFAPAAPIMAIDPTKSLLNEAIEFGRQASEGLVKGDVGEDDTVNQGNPEVM